MGKQCEQVFYKKCKYPTNQMLHFTRYEKIKLGWYCDNHILPINLAGVENKPHHGGSDVIWYLYNILVELKITVIFCRALLHMF